MEGKITTRAIIEILGHPKEHVKNAMNLLLGQLEKNNSIKILKKRSFKSKKA